MRIKLTITAGLMAPLLASVACNFPLRIGSSVPEFTAENLRQTVEAMSMPAVQEDLGAAEGHTPAPDSPYAPPTIGPAPSDSAFEYTTRSGDTLSGISGRFGFEPGELLSDPPVRDHAYLPHGQTLSIPNNLAELSPAQLLLPDAELAYSPTAIDFDIETFVEAAGGYLSEHTELVEDEVEMGGAQIVEKVASELSVNPRLLLAIIDYRCRWLFDHPPGAAGERFPLGFYIPGREGLYEEIRIAATQLNVAYYGWREGTFTTINFGNGDLLRLHPTLNAGSVALMHLLTYFDEWEGWVEDVYGPRSFASRYHNLYGDVWAQATTAGPLLPADLLQPTMDLPFRPGEAWSLTAGPHNAWNAGTPLSALDFSPITIEEPCAVSARWATASAPGQVVRARDNAVALDLDGDGYEGTGWVIVYYHIAERGMVAEGSWLERDQLIGHPSCEGGRSTGTHLHLAIKYNGEWLPADGPIPIRWSGWRVEAGERIYAGRLMNGDQVVTADPSGRAGSTIQR